jgi:catechol 2,3-dioxygenase-like lactoylglutathione lyase family enzyme
MPIEDIDHVALPTSRPEEMLEFYLGLGFSGPSLDEWQRSRSAFFSLALGDTKLNVHAPNLWNDPAMTLRAPAAVPGCADLCFRWSGTIEEVCSLLASVGAPIEEGPVARRGGREGGRANGMSVYTRDPDGNLVELIVYPDEPQRSDPSHST